MRTFFFCLLLFPLNLYAVLSTLPASHETTPIPAGYEESDDAAVWVNQRNPGKSLVLGVSKTKPKDGGKAGLGIYNLQGKEIQYIQMERLNNVDIRHNIFGMDLAAASNRDKLAISLFSVNAKGANLVANLKLKSKEEPYGFCLQQDGKKLYGWLPMKSGLLHQVQIIKTSRGFKGKEVRVIDTKNWLNRKQDTHLTNILIDDIFYEKDLPRVELMEELKEEISERFQLEGCVSDDDNQMLYVGMENLGVFKLNLKKKKAKAKLILKVAKSKELPDADSFPAGTPRVVNDIEGMSLYRTGSKAGALIVSVQGINEYAVIDRKDDSYKGNFKVSFGNDEVTETDGLFVLSNYLGKDFPFGMMVLHDHHNTDSRGKLLNANYKYVDMRHFLKEWPQYKN